MENENLNKEVLEENTTEEAAAVSAASSDSAFLRIGHLDED